MVLPVSAPVIVGAFRSAMAMLWEESGGVE
jgi:hypothetical protein